VKSFLIGLVCVFCSITWAKGDAAGDLYAKGVDALGGGDYAGAVAAFDQIIKDYPSTQNIDDVRLRDGFAYLHMGNFDNAVDRLKPETLPSAKQQYRGISLYYTAIAQLSNAGKLKDTDKTKSNAAFDQAAATFTTLIDYITTSPNPDNKDYLEDSIYNRALAHFQREAYDDTEKDLLRLTAKEFSTSLRRPDYFLLLGSLYFTEAVKTAQAAKPTDPSDPIRALAGKAVDAFNTVSADPNALIQANEANMRKAEVFYFLAPLDLPSTDGYQKALDSFRLVHRKDDLIPMQQARVNQLKAEQQARVQASPGAFINSNNLVIDREETRLKELQGEADPIIESLLRIADCYNAMKQGDEARTVLHRLAAHAKLTDDQQQDLDFQVLYSYVLGGQIDKADKALTDYLGKHASDPQADSISYQMAADLLQRKDYNGALKQAQRSLKDFPNGRYVAQAVLLEANAYTGMGKTEESQKVIDDYVAQNPKSPVAMQMLLTKAQNEVAQGKPDLALADYQKVKDNGTGDVQAIAAAGAIQTLQGMGKYDDVIARCDEFASSFPDSKALPGVMVIKGVALDQKHDPGAAEALQAAARKFPQDDASPFALYYVVNIYQRQGAAGVDKMLAAANELATAYPTSYTLLAQSADAVSTAYVKLKKFDDAIAQYQHLLDAPKEEVAANARVKIGQIWLAAAKAMGSYQSLKEETRPEAQKRLSAAEDAFVGTLKSYPTRLDAVGDAFQGLFDVLTTRRSWGLLKDADFEAALGKLTADLTTPDMVTRVELAKAGLVFITKEGIKQYPAALDRFKKAVDANADLPLTRQESSQFGELLIWGQDPKRALDVFNKLLLSATASDQLTLADSYYGLGAAYIAQGDYDNAKIYLTRMKKLNQGAAWHPHILDANYGLGLAAEKTGDDATAKPIYSAIMRDPQANFTLQAKAMLGYARILERAGAIVKQPNQQDIEYAVNYYEQVDNLFGPAVPQLSCEGLFAAAQAYAKLGDNANAKVQYKKIVDGYATTAPDSVAKAQAEIAKLGP
jgi:tetratricopeptide (TPR) repeat protein